MTAKTFRELSADTAPARTKLLAAQSASSGEPTKSTIAQVLGAQQINYLIEVAAVKTYPLDQAAARAYTINTLSIATLSGTCTAKVQIGGVDVTGLTAISVSSVQTVATATAANSVAAGAKVTLVVSANTVGLDLSLTLKMTLA